MKPVNQKSKTYLQVSAMLFASLLAQNSHATTEGGDKVGGGGSYVLLSGQKTIADPFAVAPKPTSEMQLSEESKKYLEEIKTLLLNYGIQSDDFWSLVDGDKSEYQLVDSKNGEKLPCEDKFQINANLPEIQYGCTTDGVTFLDKDVFYDQVAIQDQVLAILHERLHAFRPTVGSVNHYWITQFVTGVNTLINVMREQAFGSRRDLTKDEVDSIKSLYRRAIELGFTVNRGEIAKNGGFIKGKTTVDNSFIGVGSVVVESSIKDSMILSSLIDHSEINSNEIKYAQVFRTNSNSSKINSGQIQDSTLTNIDSIKSDLNYVKAADSKFTNTNIESSNILNSTLEDCTASGFFTMKNGSKCIKSKFTGTTELDHATTVDTIVGSYQLNGIFNKIKFSEVTIHSLHVELSGNHDGATLWSFTDGIQEYGQFGNWTINTKASGWAKIFNTTRKIKVTDPSIFYNRFHQ